MFHEWKTGFAVPGIAARGLPNVRVWQCLLPAGADAASGGRQGSFLRVPVTDGLLAEDASPAALPLHAGAQSWNPPGADHALHNRGKDSLQFVDIEWK